jgi:hypothetical protein
VGAEHGALGKWLGFAAIVLAMINVVGGYLVTDRMLGMFKKKGKVQVSVLFLSFLYPIASPIHGKADRPRLHHRLDPLHLRDQDAWPGRHGAEGESASPQSAC